MPGPARRHWPVGPVGTPASRAATVPVRACVPWTHRVCRRRPWPGAAVAWARPGQAALLVAEDLRATSHDLFAESPGGRAIRSAIGSVAGRPVGVLPVAGR